jgi:hypothetical protein
MHNAGGEPPRGSGRRKARGLRAAATAAAASFTILQAVGGIGFIADSSLTGNLGRDRVREESRGGRYVGDPRIQNQAFDRGLP